MAANVITITYKNSKVVSGSLAGHSLNVVSGAPATLVSISGPGNVRSMTISRDAIQGDVFTVDYDKNTGDSVSNGIPLKSFTGRAVTNNIVSDIYTNALGEQLIVPIGDSNAFGASADYGPTPTAGTVKQISITTGAKTNVGSTDLFDSCGTLGSSWPGFGIHYNTATGKIPCIIDLGVSGSTWGDWVSTHYAPAKVKIDAAAAALGVVPKAILIRLGVNDIGGVEGDVSAAITSMLNTVTADYPLTTIYLTQIGHGTRFSAGISMIKKLLIEATITYTNVRFSGSFQAIQANGYFYDNFHPVIAGNTEAGKMDSRAIIAKDEGYSKVSSYFISTRFDDLDLSDKTDIDTMISAIGDDIYDLDGGLIFGKTKDTRNRFIDYALRTSPVAGVDGTWTSNVSSAFNGSTQYWKLGFRPDQSFVKSSLTDFFFIIKINSITLPSGFAFLLGAFNSSSGYRTQLIQNVGGPAAAVRIFVKSADDSSDLSGTIHNGDSAGGRILANSLYFIRNGALAGTEDTTATDKAFESLEFYLGGINSDGSLANPTPFEFQYFAAGKFSTVNLANLTSALDAYVA